MRSELDPTPAQEGSATGASDRGRPAAAASQPTADPTAVTAPTGDPIRAADGSAVLEPQMSRGAAALDVVCPYLRSPGGTWRGTRPQRDHRCWAQSPPAPLSTLTQATLCLTVAHTGCGIYTAELQRRAGELARDRIAPERLSRSRFGALVQPVPLAMDAVGERGLSSAPADRTRLVGAVLIGIVAVVVLSVGIYVLGSQAAPPALIVGLASPSARATVPLPTAPTTLVPSPIPTGAGPPSPSTLPIPTAGPSASPAIAHTYRVKRGDTLRGIALRFGVTKAAVRAVNDLGTPPVLTPGQVINIPAS
jgi:LysM repeat protein